MRGFGKKKFELKSETANCNFQAKNPFVEQKDKARNLCQKNEKPKLMIAFFGEGFVTFLSLYFFEYILK